MSAANEVYVSEAVRQVQALYADLTTPEALCAVSIGEGIEKQAARLREAHQRRDPVCCTQISNWHPRLIARPEDELLEADFSLDDAKLTLAREHGFSDWAAVEREGRGSLDFSFEQAVDALLRGDVEALTAGLDAEPALIERRSPYGHGAMLLHYVGSNGVETRRQQVPLNLVEIASVLLERGADVNARARIYGGCTTLALVSSSAHPREAGVQRATEELLRAGGAR